jgi:hypothetical protein
MPVEVETYPFDPTTYKSFQADSIHQQFRSVFPYRGEHSELNVRLTQFYPNDAAGYIDYVKYGPDDIELPTTEVVYDNENDLIPDISKSHLVAPVWNTMNVNSRIVMRGRPLLLFPPADPRWYQACITLYQRAAFIGTLVLPLGVVTAADELFGIVLETDQYYSISTHDWSILAPLKPVSGRQAVGAQAGGKRAVGAQVGGKPKRQARHARRTRARKG